VRRLTVLTEDVRMMEVMSARAAAAHSGVSERTLRRWIAAGRLHADKQGGAFLVSLEDVRTLTATCNPSAADIAAAQDMSAASNTEASEVADTPQHDAALVTLVAQLHAEVSAAKDEAREYATAAAIWQERARMLGDQLALMPPQATIAAQPAVQLETGSSGAPAPFWLSWWPRLILFLAMVAAGALLLVWPR